jgi:hypothetical protein
LFLNYLSIRLKSILIKCICRCVRQNGQIYFFDNTTLK